MAGVSVTLEGATTFIGNLQAWQTRKRDEIVALVVATCLAIERDAKDLAPVDTGRLQSSIRADVQKALEDLAGIVFTNVHYAAHVEFGTVHLAAHPFLFPAWEEHVGPFVAQLRVILSTP